MCRCKFWKMDLRENSHRQRVKLVANTHGNLHEDAHRNVEDTGEEGEEEEGVVDEIHAVGVPIRTASPTPVEEGSLSSDEVLDSQLTEQDQG